MTDVFKRAENEEFIIKMVQDEGVETPRTSHDNLATMVCFHSRYNLGDEHNYGDAEEFLQSLAEDLLETETAKKFIAQKRETEFQFEIVKNEDGEYIIQTESSHNPFKGETYEEKDEAKEAIDDEFETWLEQEFLETLSVKELVEIVKEENVILPLYLYDHSGITMNTTGFSCGWDSGVVGFIYCSKKDFREETGYSENELFSVDVNRTPVAGESVKVKGHEEKSWNGYGKIISIEHEMATIDFDYMKAPSFKKEENVVIVPLTDITDVQSDKATDMLRGEVETYDQYLRGEVYGYVVEKKVGCACCGHVEIEEVDSCWGFYGDDPNENGMKDNVETEYHPLLEQMKIVF